MSAEVEIAKGEPLGRDAVRQELCLQSVALVGASPTLSLIDAAAERV